MQEQRQKVERLRLIRLGPFGQEQPGLFLGGSAHLLKGEQLPGGDYGESFFRAGGFRWLRERLETGAIWTEAAAATLRLGAPVARPSKLIAVGLNYAAHAAEVQMQAPERPILFMKASTSLSGPFDAIPLPLGAEKLDYEAELAVVIGREGIAIQAQEAAAYIAGYSILNDVSERAWQLERKGQWVKGKSYDGFAPMGPVLLEPARAAENERFEVRTWVNGKLRQEASTAQMLLDVPALIAEISSYMRLLPGDIIATGTPAGVGMGLQPPRFLRAGDRVRMQLSGLGEMEQEVRSVLPIS
ncbi:5-carboxymethyl-2-hydroxymuconatedelta-isomerase [Nitritalea halalkaliphila LW7]|uniref:5-carboxymethyl-2-hydroxymuconatedelta-isomerase n=1 Tax=Nitritalea halalkaliphila LW7 TaxID=1189621 RepID=I5C526_9BACT|nr:fumarylacetoacetate hydrolase family protein [Nitritalea halalkaliphila]EIM76928.1 5-carboxymethyl-2-hydroxymuconatedelta-isomerase [Nitritalea halalkaliphila LW7]